MMSPPKILLVTGALVLSGSLVACSSDGRDAAERTGTTSTGVSTTSTTVAGPSTSGAPATVTSSPVVGVNDLGPVGTDEPLEVGTGVTVSVTDVKFLDVDSRAPGETSGPAAAVTLEVRNDSSAPFDLGQVAVSATYGEALPAIPTDADPADAVTGSLPAGKSRTGVYVFRLGDEKRPPVLVTVGSGTGPNVLRFQL